MKTTTTGINDESVLFSKPVTLGRGVVFFVIMFVGTVADLLTKHFVFGKYFKERIKPGQTPETIWWIQEWLGVQTSTNQGALFGMGQGLSMVFALLSVVAFSLLIYLLFFNRWANDLFITVTFAMIAAGIFGNLYDRLGLWHDASIAAEHQNAVRDWIHFNWEGGPRIMNPWPNFNVADIQLVCGAALLCIHAVFVQPKMEKTKSVSNQGLSDQDRVDGAESP